MRPSRQRRVLAALLLLIATTCAAPQRRADETTSAHSAAPADEPARLARLEREARALVHADGCAKTSDCRTAPLGWRACGGPRAYVAYCAATTDSVALFRKLDELKDAEMAYNQKSGMASTCEMRLPPVVTAAGGSCRASP